MASGQSLERVADSCIRMDGGEFPTEVPRRAGDLRAFLRWRWQRRGVVRAHRRRGEALPAVARPDGSPPPSDGDSVTWCGHASVLTRLDGRTILSDPNWSQRLVFVVRRLTPARPAWNALPRVDLVTLSHNHYDHLDLPTLRRLRATNPLFLAPRGVGRMLRQRGFRRVEELDWWQTRDVDGLRATLVPSRHFSGRTPWDFDTTLWGGWVLQGERHQVYHAGDTGYFSGFRDIGRRFPRLDVACLPIGAYEPRWFMRDYHVDPDEAGQAFLDVGATALLPIHWGTFRLSDEAMDAPPERIRSFFRSHGLDASRLWLGDLGQAFPLPD